MSDESVGYYWSQRAKEDESMERHDREHTGDSTQWYQDCEICFERFQQEKVSEKDIDHSIENDIDSWKEIRNETKQQTT